VKFRPPGAEQHDPRCLRSGVRATTRSRYRPAAELRTPPSPAFATARPRPADKTSARPGVEICCEECASPQSPRRRFKLEQVYGTEPVPVVCRVQLSNPLVAGKPRYVKPRPRNCPEPSGCEPDRLNEWEMHPLELVGRAAGPHPPPFFVRSGDGSVHARHRACSSLERKGAAL
jgi:hypothetical protein